MVTMGKLRTGGSLDIYDIRDNLHPEFLFCEKKKKRSLFDETIAAGMIH